MYILGRATICTTLTNACKCKAVQRTAGPSQYIAKQLLTSWTGYIRPGLFVLTAKHTFLMQIRVFQFPCSRVDISFFIYVFITNERGFVRYRLQTRVQTRMLDAIV